MSASALAGQHEIAIIGGGLGGTTAAILLQRAGFPCLVYEQASAFSRVGAGINLAPNSLRVLRQLGVLEHLLQCGLQPREKISRDWASGQVTYRADICALAEKYEAPFLAIHRADLQAVLSAAMAPDTVAFGKRLIATNEHNGRVVLAFADGSRSEADIVIGADGVNSKVREALLGPETPTYSGLAAYRSLFPADALGSLNVADYTKWWGPDRDVIAYYTTRTRDEFYLLAITPEEWGTPDLALQIGDVARVRTAFQDFHTDVQKILAACTEVTRAPMLQRDPLSLWSRGRIVMLGDACHPMAPYMGQGAGMAIEDAFMLARCLQAEREPEAAFRRYEATRFERTARVQVESNKNDWMRYAMDHSWVYGYDVLSAPIAHEFSGSRETGT